MPNDSVYIVRPGDSMWKIAMRHRIGISELIDANPQISNPSLIHPNQRINIPSRVPQPCMPQPGMPQQPGMPEQPGMPQQPGLPEQPGMPQEPGVPEQPGMPQQPSVPQPGTPQMGNLEEQVVNLVNMEREQRGLRPLTVNPELTRVARYKSEDMESNNYFSHQSPNYGSPFDMLRNFGVSFTAAGENIAKGQTTAQSVMDAWMNSTGHRENILSTTFTQIGVGYANNQGVPYWTQIFIRP